MKETEVLYSWNFSTEKNRGKFWYTIALALVIGIVIRGFIMKQWGLSFVVMIIAGVYIFVENSSNELVDIKLTSLGIFVDKSFYEYSNIRAYSIIYEDEGKPILLRLYLKMGMKMLDLDVDLETTKKIKKILGNYIEENVNGEMSFFDKIIRILKL